MADQAAAQSSFSILELIESDASELGDACVYQQDLSNYAQTFEDTPKQAVANEENLRTTARESCKVHTRISLPDKEDEEEGEVMDVDTVVPAKDLSANKVGTKRGRTVKGVDQPLSAKVGGKSQQRKSKENSKVIAQSVKYMSEQLQEPKLRLLTRVVTALGSKRALNLLQETIETDMNGGILTTEGDRKRSMGGAFFYLLKRKVSEADLKYIFAEEQQIKKQQKQRKRRRLNGNKKNGSATDDTSKVIGDDVGEGSDPMEEE